MNKETNGQNTLGDRYVLRTPYLSPNVSAFHRGQVFWASPLWLILFVLSQAPFVFAFSEGMAANAIVEAADSKPSSHAVLSHIEKMETEFNIPSGEEEKVEQSADGASFTSQIAGKEETIEIRTLFNPNSTTIDKKFLIRQGHFQSNGFRLVLQGDNAFQQTTVPGLEGDSQIFSRDTETFFYKQSVLPGGTAKLKEWIQARVPNHQGRSRFVWKLLSAEFNAYYTFEPQADGSVHVYRNMLVAGVDPAKRAEHKRIIEVVRKVIGGWVSIKDHELMGIIEAPFYITAKGEKKSAAFKLEGENTLTLEINEQQESYPLMIDPTLNWGHWLGGTGLDEVDAVAVNGDEIYAGGKAANSTNWETATNTGGAHSGGTYEGFVVEIADGATPSLPWIQWLGGSGDDRVTSVAVTGDEIYAGGLSSDSTSWESPTNTGGTHSGSYEGFVVEIADGDTPSLPWLQWLGGTGIDAVAAVAVTGDEIYAGGQSASTTSWETPTENTGGTHSGGDEGFVVEIADGTSPAFPWLQWLGGTGNESVRAIAVTGDEIYVGGDSASATSWEVTPSGTISGVEGFIAEVADNGASSPTVPWAQWIGGTGSDYVYALAVNGDEIYAGGYGTNGTTWDLTLQGTNGGGNEGFVIEIGDGASPSLVWGQWVGGATNDFVKAMAVNGDKIYCGGTSNDASTWEAFAFSGTLGSNEGFLAVMVDGTLPTLNWAQWLGSSSTDEVYAVAFTGNELYAGMRSDSPSSWETVTIQGSHSGTDEGAVIEVKDDMIVAKGTLYQTNETTAITGAAKTVNIKVNGVGSYTAESSSSDGTWIIRGITVAAGDTITAYLDVETEDANTVTITDGAADILDLNLFDDHVILRSDNGATAITIPDTWDYDNTQNATEMLFDAVDAAPDTLSVEDGNELYINASDTFTPGGTVTVGTGGLEINGTWTATTTEAINISGNWDNVDGTFTAASSTVTFNASSGTQTLNSGGTGSTKQFYSIAKSNAGTLQPVSNDVYAADSFTVNIGGGTIDHGTGNRSFTILGNISVNSGITWTKGTGTITLSGGGAVTNTIDFGGKTIEDIVLNDSDGGKKQLTNASTVTTDSLDIQNGTIDFNGKNLTTTGNFTIGTGGQVTGTGLGGSTITVQGNFSTTGESGDLLLLNEDTTIWNLNITGTTSAGYVNVAYSNSDKAISVSDCESVNGNSNTNWNFTCSDTSGMFLEFF